MTDTPGDVAAKLEGSLIVLSVVAGDRSWIGTPMDTEAASYLGQALQAAVFAVEAEMETLRAAASMLRECAEREKALREALEPFAAVAVEAEKRYLRHIPDNHLSSLDYRDESGSLLSVTGPTLGDLRRAAKALEAK